MRNPAKQSGLPPAVHFKSEEYKSIYKSLLGTKCENKCPDFQVGDRFYEFESFTRPWNKKKVGRMISHGLAQSQYIVIDNTKGCSDRYIRKAIIARSNLRGQDVKEVWIYEKGNIRLLFKGGRILK